jgi:hypothetical protein
VARAYTVGTVALALGTPVKWVDNALSHHSIPGVTQERQGIARHVSLEGVLHLAIGMLLIQELSITLSTALRLASAITSQDGQYLTAGGLSLRLDLPRFKANIERRLAQAVEIAPVPRRGRPPSSKTGRLE